MAKRKKIFKIIFGAIFKGIGQILLFFEFLFIFLFLKIFVRCKIKGKNNYNKNDEARVFLFNHYEIYGPVAAYLNFPYKFKPWVMDKLIDPKTVKEQMSVGVYNKFPKYPKWFKTIMINLLKNLVIFSVRYAGAIPVSRETIKDNIKTLQKSEKCLKSGKNIAIFPEMFYKDEGIGKFMSGFEHLGKYYYQKTGKKISFYPVFISEKNKTIYIEKPVIYNPSNDPTLEKNRIINYAYETMLDSYIKNELSSNVKIKKKRK